MSNGLRVVLSAFALVMALMVGVAVVDSFSQAAGTGDGDVTRDAALLGSAGTFVSLNDGIGENQTVYKTTGYALNLTGADDSYFESTKSVDLAADDNWTVSVWGNVDQGAGTKNMTAVSVNGRVIVRYNGTAGNWTAWYYDGGSRNSYQVNVSTSGTEVGNFTNVQVVANGTHLAIYRGGTAGETTSITSSSSVDAPVGSGNWDGRLEEVRTFDAALDATTRSELVNSPVDQQPDQSPTARIMFDQPGRNQQLLLYTGARVTTSNATFSAGFDEQIMQEQSLTNDIAFTTDYKWHKTGPEIAPTSGGELDGAPVAYATYDFGTDGVADVSRGWADMVKLAAIIPLLAIMTVMLSKLRDI